MRKSFIVALILLFASTIAFADLFSPTMLQFTAPASITYSFDGSACDVDFTQTGTAAEIIFSIHTKGKAGQIKDIRNGYLGWHYVNNIDTCLYIGGIEDMDVGSNTLTWDGRDAAGTIYDGPEATYYIWGFDYAGTKTSVCALTSPDWKDQVTFITKDETGNPISNPIMCTNDSRSGPEADLRDQTYNKWEIGNDPEDALLLEATKVQTYVFGYDFAIDPEDHDIFYVYDQDPTGLYSVKKYRWVPDDYAEYDPSWGEEDGMTSWTTGGIGDYDVAGVVDLGEGMLGAQIGDGMAIQVISELLFLDRYTGDEIKRMDTGEVFLPIRPYQTEPSVRTPTTLDLKNGKLFMGMCYATMLTCANPYYDAEEDFWLWWNLAGDGVNDRGGENPDYWSADGSKNPDFTREYPFGQRQDGTGHFTSSIYDLGATSFDMGLPDGTGIGYFSYAGETASGVKAALAYIAADTAYEGMYMDNTSGAGQMATTGWWFIGHDSISGTITSGVGVEDTAPAAYTVAQNSPNPFNPTTTISFKLASAGNVTVDVYNVAGQKVDTIVNEFMDAGSQSVVWDASDFSAGVYFYTVKSGDFSKTMKMTLLK